MRKPTSSIEASGRAKPSSTLTASLVGGDLRVLRGVEDLNGEDLFLDFSRVCFCDDFRFSDSVCLAEAVCRLSSCPKA